MVANLLTEVTLTSEVDLIGVVVSKSIKDAVDCGAYIGESKSRVVNFIECGCQSFLVSDSSGLSSSNCFRTCASAAKPGRYTSKSPSIRRW